eukprot:TRINITY_DN2036_c0_g1_i8.p1 TRINITY_DN2036_c0_g1~~TRINITY_DN2036_c0_g1_i8.p1  ORF type:complete len:643 (-),score=170.64 TRINITY_DN2036_c0_g1_i8:16-1944(-)
MPISITIIACHVPQQGEYDTDTCHSGVLGPSLPEKTTTLENMFASFGMPQVGIYDTDPKLTSPISGYSNLVAICPSEIDFVAGNIQTILAYGWRKVVFLSTGDSTGISVSLKFEEQANQNGIRVMDTILLQDTSAESFQVALKRIAANPTRLIVTLFDDTYLTLFQEADALGMMNKEYVWIHSAYAGEGRFYYSAQLSNLTAKLDEWLDGSFTVVAATTIGEYGIQHQNRLIDFSNKIQNLYVVDEFSYPSTLNYIWDSMLVFLSAAQKMVEKNISFTDQSSMIKELRNVSVVGSSGPISFSSSGGRQQLQFKLSNYRKGVGYRTVGYFNPKLNFTGTSYFRDASTQIPLDSLPPNEEYINKGLIIALYIFGSLNILFYMFNLALIVKFRRTTLIQQSGYLYLHMILIGSILMVSSVFVLGTDMQFVSKSTRDRLCMLSVWQIGIGYVFLFGSLFAKSLRILLIINKPELKNSNNVDRMITTFLCICFTIEIIFLIIWTSVDQLKAQPKLKDDERTLFYWCESESYGFPVAWISFNMFFLFCGVVIAYLTKDVERRFNESKIIGFSIYNVFILCTIIIPLTFTIKDSPSITFAFQCIGVIGVPLGSAVMLFGKYIFVLLSSMKSHTNSNSGKTTVQEQQTSY